MMIKERGRLSDLDEVEIIQRLMFLISSAVLPCLRSPIDMIPITDGEKIDAAPGDPLG